MTINTNTISSLIIRNAQVEVYSSAIATSDIDAISTSMILRLLFPQWVNLMLGCHWTTFLSLEPKTMQIDFSLFYLRIHNTVLEPKLPFEFHNSNVLMVLDFKALPSSFCLLWNFAFHQLVHWHIGTSAASAHCLVFICTDSTTFRKSPSQSNLLTPLFSKHHQQNHNPLFKPILDEEVNWSMLR